jgi:hypothetical protein
MAGFGIENVPIVEGGAMDSRNEVFWSSKVNGNFFYQLERKTLIGESIVGVETLSHERDRVNRDSR